MLYLSSLLLGTAAIQNPPIPLGWQLVPLLILSSCTILAALGLGLMLKGLSMRKDLVKARMFLHFDRVLIVARVLIPIVIIWVAIYTGLCWAFPHQGGFGEAFMSWEKFLAGGFVPCLVMIIATWVGFWIYSLLR